MKRRIVLRRLGTGGLMGLGGCVSAPTSAPHPSPTSTSRSDSTSLDKLTRRVSLVGQDPVPGEYQVRVETTVLEPMITDAHTARIQVAVTNDGPPREISVSTGGCALFNRWSQTSHPRGLWLGFADEPRYATQMGPRWIAAPPEDGAFPDYGCAGRKFASGESVHNEYAVFHDGRVDGYLKADTYRFEQEGFFSPVSKERDANTSILYAFSLTVENPNCTFCFSN